MTATVEFYEHVSSAFPDTESLTILVASGVTREDVLAGLGADLSDRVEDSWDAGERFTAWAAINVPGGVLAVELTGYGDPSLPSLAALSKAGASAVVRSNVQAHYRFGCARAGKVVFDDDEFVYVDPAGVPADLRPLFDAAWTDLGDEDGLDDERADPFATGLAMAELVTGVELTEDLVAAVLESDFFSAPSLRYAPGEEDAEQPEPPAKVKLAPGVRKVDDRDLWTGKGVYMLISGWDFAYDQERRPKGLSKDFGLTTGDHAAWVGSLTPLSSTRLLVTALSSKSEPTVMLERLRAAYPHEASGVVVAREPGSPSRHGGLRAVGKYDMGGVQVTDAPGTFVLHVFARWVAADEEHVLVTWPATG